MFIPFEETFPCQEHFVTCHQSPSQIGLENQPLRRTTPPVSKTFRPLRCNVLGRHYARVKLLLPLRATFLILWTVVKWIPGVQTGPASRKLGCPQKRLLLAILILTRPRRIHMCDYLVLVMDPLSRFRRWANSYSRPAESYRLQPHKSLVDSGLDAACSLPTPIP